MAGELMLFGIQKLLDLLSQECERFQGFENQVAELKRRLNLLKSFVKDADAKKHTSEVVKTYVEDIKEIICDGEDIFETFIVKEKLREQSRIKNIRRLAWIINRRKNASEIGDICTRISNVIEDMKNFGVQEMRADGWNMQPPRDIQREMRQTFPNENESDFVGLEANVKKLIGYLVEKENVQVVSITGMGGLGKTTLARQVFNHEDVKHHFDRLAWVCISQDFSRIFVWQTILQKLAPKERKKEIMRMKEDELQAEIFELLKTSKSLIVFDDIWKEDDWNFIKLIFPPKTVISYGWKVLLTSRNDILPVSRDEQYINLKPEFLSIKDSWTLFQRIALPENDASEFKKMEEVGRHMVKRCEGLPLAIKVLGGLLAAEKYTLHDWEILSEDIGSRIVGLPNFDYGNNSSVYHSVYQILSLSFEELPTYLKQCFLFLAFFPEDYVVRIEKLSYYWAADGILEPRHYDGGMIKDVGHHCIEELVRRNMIISKRNVGTLRFETCHLHDMVREICLLKAKEENFLQISSSFPQTSNVQSPVTSRRFVSHYPATLHVETDINNPNLRSLVVVWHNRGTVGNWELSGSSYKRLELLRVLDLCKAKFRGGKLPSSIGKLIHLRYLSLEDAEVSHLPSSLGNLILLIYLNIEVDAKDIFVPNVLMEMQELRYLILPVRMHKKTKLELSNLVKLEGLENFSTKNGSVKDFCGMAKLRTLGININDETSLETLSASINGLKHLEFLTIEDQPGISSERRIEEGILLDFIHLTYLWLNIKLRGKQHFPSQLRMILLWNCGLEEDPMPILENLLQLKVVCLLGQSFSVRRMVCSGGGFPQLHKLVLWGLEEWEEWIVEEGSMPLLHTLSIWNCPKLKELPDGLRFIYSLKELRIDKGWKERVSEGGEDYYKVQHIPSIDFLTELMIGSDLYSELLVTVYN